MLLALIGLVAAAGCGGGGDEGAGTATTVTTETETTTETDGDTDEEPRAAGRAVFVSSCAGCHTLDDADATGSVGPSLDGLALTEDEVEQQVREGGGGMPSFEGELSDEEIDQVSAYVAAAARGE